MKPFVPGNHAMDMGGLLTFRCGAKHVKTAKKLSKWFRALCGYNMVLRLLRYRPNAVGLSSTWYGHTRGQLQRTPQVCTITITNRTEVYQHQHQDTHHLRLCFWNTSKSNSLNINQWEHNPSLTSGRVSRFHLWNLAHRMDSQVVCLSQFDVGSVNPIGEIRTKRCRTLPVLEGLMARLPLVRGLPSCSFARSPAPCLPGPLASGTCLYRRPCGAQVMER